jgi:plastocyanin
MRFAILAALPALVAAQNYGGPAPAAGSSSAGSPSSTSAAPLPTATVTGQHIVQVAPGATFMFQPQVITAAVNETVTFAFPAGTLQHSVTQSSFAKPCNLLNEDGGGPIGFDSGFQSGTQFTITITNASQPIWFFCKQNPPSHCASGMVGGINVNTTGPFGISSFAASASALGANFAKDTGSGSLSGLGAMATAAAASVSASSSSPPSSGATHLIAASSSALIALAAALTILA